MSCEVSKAKFFRPWNGAGVSATKSLQMETVKSEVTEDNDSSFSSYNRQSVSSCSTINSNDDPMPPSLDVPSNFVFCAQRTDENRDTGVKSLVSPSNPTSVMSMLSSAFAPTYQCPSLCPDYYNMAQLSSMTYPLESYQRDQLTSYGLSTMDAIAHYQSNVEEAFKLIQQQDMAAKQIKKLRPKKFRCEHCNVAFSNNGQLKGHVRIHTGERPFKCDAENCGKSFTRNEELTRHKRIHTGQRPHPCPVCGKRFGRKDHLKKHTRTHDNRGSYHLGPFTLAGHHAISSSRYSTLAPYIFPM